MVDFVRPGEGISARKMNEIIERLNALDAMQVEPPLALTRDGGRPGLRIESGGFWAMITAVKKRPSSSSSSSGAHTSSSSAGVLCPSLRVHQYSWAELQPVCGGAWEFRIGGRDGAFNAYEVNDLSANAGTVVWMLPFLQGEWRFEAGAAAAVTDVECVNNRLYVTKAGG